MCVCLSSQSVLLEFLDVDWKTEQFAELLFGDYLNREDKVCTVGILVRAANCPQ